MNVPVFWLPLRGNSFCFELGINEAPENWKKNRIKWSHKRRGFVAVLEQQHNEKKQPAIATVQRKGVRQATATVKTRWWQKCRHSKLAKINMLLWCECAKHAHAHPSSTLQQIAIHMTLECLFECVLLLFYSYLYMVIWTFGIPFWFAHFQLGNFVGNAFYLLFVFFLFFCERSTKKSIGIWIWITSSVVIIIIFIHINFDGIGVECAALTHSPLTSFNKSF